MAGITKPIASFNTIPYLVDRLDDFTEPSVSGAAIIANRIVKTRVEISEVGYEAAEIPSSYAGEDSVQKTTGMKTYNDITIQVDLVKGNTIHDFLFSGDTDTIKTLIIAKVDGAARTFLVQNVKVKSASITTAGGDDITSINVVFQNILDVNPVVVDEA